MGDEGVRGLRAASWGVALFGVAGEVLLLWHQLVDSYPYKMLRYPPAEHFERFANVALAGMFIVAVLVALYAGRRTPVSVALLVPLLTPLLASALLWAVTALAYPWPSPSGARNFDGYTPNQALGEFATYCALLAAVALACGILATGLYRGAHWGLRALRSHR